MRGQCQVTTLPAFLAFLQVSAPLGLHIMSVNTAHKRQLSSAEQPIAKKQETAENSDPDIGASPRDQYVYIVSCEQSDQYMGDAFSVVGMCHSTVDAANLARKEANDLAGGREIKKADGCVIIKGKDQESMTYTVRVEKMKIKEVGEVPKETLDESGAADSVSFNGDGKRGS